MCYIYLVEKFYTILWFYSRVLLTSISLENKIHWILKSQWTMLFQEIVILSPINWSIVSWNVTDKEMFGILFSKKISQALHREKQGKKYSLDRPNVNQHLNQSLNLCVKIVATNSSERFHLKSTWYMSETSKLMRSNRLPV